MGMKISQSTPPLPGESGEWKIRKITTKQTKSYFSLENY